jgi:hypothetical protein
MSLGPRAAFITLLAAAIGGECAYAASERPLFLPARDVAVDYSVQVGASASSSLRPAMRVSYTADGSHLRVDPVDGLVPVIADLAGHRTVLLFPDRKAYLDVPFDPRIQRLLMLNDSMGFTREGTATVAGVPCVEWQIRNGSETARGCITEDGVVLEGEAGSGKSHTLLRASKVVYGAQPPSLFAPPPDWHKIGAK